MEQSKQNIKTGISSYSGAYTRLLKSRLEQQSSDGQNFANSQHPSKSSFFRNSNMNIKAPVKSTEASLLSFIASGTGGVMDFSLRKND